MSARARIFERVRSAVAQVPPESRRPLPEVPHGVATARPDAEALRTGPRLDLFKTRLQSVRGLIYDDLAALGAWLQAQGATRGVCDPSLVTLFETGLGPAFTLETAVDRTRIDDYRFGVTRATGAIAETGTIILTDGGTFSRLAALAPFIHIAVLSPATIYDTVADAVAAQEKNDDPNIIWCTGPSKTADVEGILIEGVHGPGEQVALIL